MTVTLFGVEEEAEAGGICGFSCFHHFRLEGVDPGNSGPMRVEFFHKKPAQGQIRLLSDAAQLSDAAIFQLNPDRIGAGSWESLTIVGRGFGNEIGNIRWTHADTTGSSRWTFTTGWQGYIQSWSDSEIVVKVPTDAGSGRISIITAAGDSIESDKEIRILYNLMTPTTFYDYPRFPRHVHFDDSGGHIFHFDSSVPEEARQSFRRAVETWVRTLGVNWSVSDEGGNCPVRFDGQEVTGNTLGRARSGYIFCGSSNPPYVSELSIQFNPEKDWFFGENPDDIKPNQHDFESVALHELGHCLGLGHSVESSEVMHAVMIGVKRTITPNATLAGAQLLRIASDTNGSICGRESMDWLPMPSWPRISIVRDESGMSLSAEKSLPMPFELFRSSDLMVWEKTDVPQWDGAVGLTVPLVPMSDASQVFYRAVASGYLP